VPTLVVYSSAHIVAWLYRDGPYSPRGFSSQLLGTQSMLSTVLPPKASIPRQTLRSQNILAHENGLSILDQNKHNTLEYPVIV
jgi:hypothetical protein